MSTEPVPFRELILPAMQNVIDLAASQGCLPTDPEVIEKLRERGYELPADTAKQKPVAVELFAGAGGAALGLKAAGFEHLACIENDHDACETLRAAGLPYVEADVRDPDIYESEWFGCDLLWSSFPCQCWSTGGSRLGAQDERNGWPWTVDVLDCLEPEWFAAENVLGLTQHKGECGWVCLGPELCPRAYFDLIILGQLRERFEWVGWRVLDAADFGVPQHRRRVVIVAGPRPIVWPEPTHGKPTKQPDMFGRQLAPWATVGQALGLRGLMHTGGEDYRERDDRKTRERPASTDEPSPTVGGRGNAMVTPERVIGGGRNDSLPHRSPRTFRDLTDEPCTTIAASQIGNAGPWVEPGRRRLTVEECATLQDFPAGYPFHGNKTSRYMQVGNAVPPTLARVVGERIVEAGGDQ